MPLHNLGGSMWSRHLTPTRPLWCQQVMRHMQSSSAIFNREDVKEEYLWRGGCIFISGWLFLEFVRISSSLSIFSRPYLSLREGFKEESFICAFVRMLVGVEDGCFMHNRRGIIAQNKRGIVLPGEANLFIFKVMNLRWNPCGNFALLCMQNKNSIAKSVSRSTIKW